MKTIHECLHQGIEELQESDTPSLDAEVLLCHILKKEKAYLYTYPSHLLSEEESDAYDELLKRRQQGEPVAYLVGKKFFWSMEFTVTKEVLIPRPETETLVEAILQLPLPPEASFLELGTGSGALICALAKEFPQGHHWATDISNSALKMAIHNAKHNGLQSNIQFIESDWFSQIPPLEVDVILSNPPYLSKEDPHLSSLKYEPLNALVSGPTGLEALFYLIQEASKYLKPGGWLLLEHGCDQEIPVTQAFTQHGYEHITTLKDLAGLPRVTKGQKFHEGILKKK